MIIACVLWVGPDRKYNPLHVERLRTQVREFAPAHRFVCLTNVENVSCETILLQDGNPWFWSKIEMLKPGLFDDRVLYLDLDVEIVGDLTPIMEYPSSFAAIKDYQNKRQINSSVMVFDPGAGAAAYTPDPPITDYHGDQGWISDAIPDIERLPKDWCISYRWQAKRFGVPANAKVVVYHGAIKPWSVAA